MIPAGNTQPLTVETDPAIDNQPVVRGYRTSDVLVSGTGLLPAGESNKSFTLFMVAQSGTTATNSGMVAIGNNGGVLALRPRNSNLVQAVKGTNSTTFSTVVSQTMSGSAYHLIELCYDDVLHQARILVDGVLVSGGTPSSGIASYTHTFATSKISVLGTYDQAASPQLVAHGLNASVALCGVAWTHAPDNPAWQAALVAMVDERFPSLGL